MNNGIPIAGLPKGIDLMGIKVPKLLGVHAAAMSPSRQRIFILNAFLCTAIWHEAARAGLGQEQGHCFVTREGTTLLLNGCPFRMTGTNQYYQMIHRRLNDRSGVNEVLDEMAARRMTVLRTWAFQDDAGRSDCLQCAPARQLALNDRPTNYLNEATFRGLDELLVQASRRGIRVILTLVNNWNDFAGMQRYTLWRFGPQDAHHDAFYSDPLIRTWFKEYIARIVNRVNSVNGRRYRDDPTILAWELANEPRCLDALDCPCRTDAWIHSWILDVSCYIKSIDSNHLVTTGVEGFYGASHSDGNPDSWMTHEGTDFIDIHDLPCVDFATLHVWPLNWGWAPIADTDAALARAREYVLRRLVDGKNVLGKPVVIEEFGVPRDDNSRCPDPGVPGPASIRDRFYAMFFGLCEEYASPYGSCAGALCWMVYDTPSCNYDDGNGVFLPQDASTDLLMSDHVRDFGSCSGLPHAGDDSCQSNGDVDWQCDIDLTDFRRVHECLSGPETEPALKACALADGVLDGRVDLRDVARFQIGFSGNCP